MTDTINQYLAILASRCKHDLVLPVHSAASIPQVITPFNGQYGAAFRIEFEFGVRLLGRPNAHKAVVRAAGEQFLVGVPLDLIDNFHMTVPSYQGTIGLLYAPEVDEFALPCHGYVFIVLPFYFQALKVSIDVLMVEAGDLSTVLSRTVPHIDLTHEASCRDQIVILRAELALHQVLIKDLHVGDLNVALLIHSVHPSNHIRRRSQKLVTLCIPVD